MTADASRRSCDFRSEIAASFSAIELLFSQFRRCCHCRLQDQTPFIAELLLREALTNAVVHGSHTDPAKLVRCAIRIRRNRLLIAVTDEGEGFDWRAARNSQAASSACSGRGMEIFRKYATRVRFNERGTAVIISKTFDAKTHEAKSIEEEGLSPRELNK